MKRREFLKAIAAIPPLLLLTNEGTGAEKPGESLSIARGADARVYLSGIRRGDPDPAIESAVRAAAEAATDFSWLSKGQAVFIKPALNSGRPYPATTSPTAVAAMIRLLKSKGAGRVVVGDMSGIEHVKLSPNRLTGSSRRLMEESGMAAAVVASGGELHFFEEAGWNAFYEDAPASGAHWKRGLMMPNILKEVEHVILMPRCSRHALAGSTLGLKCAVGYWRTDTRLEYHRDASTFQEKTAEGNTVETLTRKQRLVLSAADKILANFGPDKGYVVRPEIGLCIASESIVAHDMVSLAWFLENRRDLPKSEKTGYNDPYELQFVVSLANRWVVKKLGGWAPTLEAEKLTRNDINSIWDDRVLNHAYRVFGGRPAVFLDAANDKVPDFFRQRLAKMVA